MDHSTEHSFNNVVVKFAKSEDIAGMIEVLNSNLISNKPSLNKELLESQGFLIHGFSKENIETAISDREKNIILVASANNEVIGYLLAYDLHTENPDWLLHMQISPAIEKILATKRVAYYRHIAKKTGKIGVGTQLFKVFHQEALARNYQYLICQIVHEPFRNKISLAFHEKLGFHLVGTTKEENRIAGLYLKEVSNF